MEKPTGARLTFSERLRQIRRGFERPFWIANVSEIFERLSYYAVFAALARYLHEALHFPTQEAASLSGVFGGAVWVMAIFGGALADRIGFRRALSLAYFILSCSYFLVGSIAAPWLAPVRMALPLELMVGIILFLPALGVALVKPSVVGTTARASKENVRSIGYSIYYTLVNIGSFLGPFAAGWIHSRMQVESVFRLAALSVFLMFIAVLIFFKEPRRESEQQTATLAKVSRNLLTVLGNGRFVLFLLIFSGYWVVFWQQYLILPIYIHDYVDAEVNTELILITDPLIVITLTVAVNALTRRVSSFRAITLGTLITAVGWLVIGSYPGVWTAVATLAVVALGEIMQSPRYYEYISRLAPPGQQGTYMGFAFLPIGIGSLVGGWIAGKLLHHFGEVVHQPNRIWWAVTGVGVVTAALLWLYDKKLGTLNVAATRSTPAEATTHAQT
jgi:proton-dependent oligopeptide transporter, POT family